MKKLHTILLIDDDFATNFLHKMILEKENCAENIIAKQSAKEALEYLKSNIEEGHPHPELIFLDINMPGMNGWDFLEEYQKIDKEHKVEKIVIMLTTSLDPLDRKKAESIEQVTEFKSKPLTNSALKQVLKSNFPDIFDHY